MSDWMDLHEASEHYGVPSQTLRYQAVVGAIVSRVAHQGLRPRRELLASSIEEWLPRWRGRARRGVRLGVPFGELVFIDTETTSLRTDLAEVVDLWVSRAREEDLVIVAEGGGLVMPIGGCEPGAAAVNGFDATRWAERGAAPFVEVWDRVGALLEGATAVVGSNPWYDLQVLSSELARAGRTLLFPPRVVDTCTLARARGWEGVGLGALCDRLGVEVDEAPAHSARGDVLRTIEVYRRLRS